MSASPSSVTHPLDPAAVRVLLLDADGNLFASEEPAFVASAEVTNACLAELGIDRRYEPEELRLATTGRTFRSTITWLADEAGRLDRLSPDRLDAWVAEEQRAVTAHLGAVLRPDPQVGEPLRRLAARFELAVVSSSALGRLDACFAATGLDGLVPAGRRFSAEDSLDEPRSKPDPAVYLLAGRELGARGSAGLAVEDSVPGTQSAVAAGFPTVGNLVFVPEAERAERESLLIQAGATAIVDGWAELEDLLDA